MFVGILFTVIISLSIGMFSTLVWRRRGTVNYRFSSPGIQAFALFWLTMSVVWYIIAAIDFLGYLGRRDISLPLTYIMQAFVGFSLVVASYFLYQTLFPAERPRFILFIYGILYFVFLATLFVYDVQLRPDSFFASQIIVSDATRFIFVASVIPLLVASAVLFILYYGGIRRPERAVRRFYILSGLSLVFLGVAGSIDEIGLVWDWMVTATRLITLISAISGYVSLAALQESDELVI